MQMDAQFLFQVGAVVASLSGAWALVRAQVNTLKATQEEIKSHVDELNRELDEAENSVAVLRQQIKVLSDILSPDNLASEHKRKGMVKAHISKLQEEVKILQHMHNGRHPIIDKEYYNSEKED
jgi:chromosome segregation ATPase